MHGLMREGRVTPALYSTPQAVCPPQAVQPGCGSAFILIFMHCWASTLSQTEGFPGPVRAEILWLHPDLPTGRGIPLFAASAGNGLVNAGSDQ
jgi:hypothetical protein